MRDGSAVDDCLGLVRGTGGDVGEGPGGLELEAGVVEVGEELHEAREDAEVDHDIYGWVPLPGEDLPGSLGALELFVTVSALDSVLNLLDRESRGGLLVLTQRGQRLVFNGTAVPPLGEHVLLLVLPELHGDLIPPSAQLVIVLPFVLEVLQPVLSIGGRHFEFWFVLQKVKICNDQA